MPADQIRNRTVGCKMSDSEYERLSAVVESEGMTLGEWCREALAGGRPLTRRSDLDFAFFWGGLPFAVFAKDGWAILMRRKSGNRGQTGRNLSHQTRKFPPTPSILFTSTRLIRMILLYNTP